MITEEQVKDALREVYDPEISVNVQDLGLIYEVKVDNTEVHVKHTLTSFMCPFAEEICRDIEDAVWAIEGVTEVHRELVFDPPFGIEQVPEETRTMMGWY